MGVNLDDVVHIHGHRTPAQITAQLEARYAEMQAEADRLDQDPETHFPCQNCRWYSDYRIISTFEMWCSEPLVKGFGVKHLMGRYGKITNRPALCGPEKALWQRRGLRGRLERLWLRLTDYLTKDTPHDQN